MTVIVNGNLMIDEGTVDSLSCTTSGMYVRTSTGVLRLIRTYLGYGYRRTTLTFLLCITLKELSLTNRERKHTLTSLWFPPKVHDLYK